MAYLPGNYFLLPPEHSGYAGSRVVIFPVPLERTTTYGKGTARGPGAILTASHAVETWDEELESEPFRLGIATTDPFLPDTHDLGATLDAIEAEARRHLEAGKFLVTLGGEHSLTLAPVRAARAVYGEIGVVQLDAHADLRDEYEGTPYSHAAVMRRILEDGLPTAAVGIRAVSREEGELILERRLPVIWGWELEDHAVEDHFRRLLDALPHHVYLTFDLDFFDPALLPATGTPEPGGGRWWPTLRLLKILFAEKEVVAADVVELAPIPGHHASDFVAARLVYKLVAYLQACGRGTTPPPAGGSEDTP